MTKKVKTTDQVTDLMPETTSFFAEPEKIWQEIKDVQLNLFALPNQTVQKHCQPQLVEPTRLYVTFSAGAVGPALEAALSNYSVEIDGKYVIIGRK